MKAETEIKKSIIEADFLNNIVKMLSENEVPLGRIFNLSNINKIVDTMLFHFPGHHKIYTPTENNKMPIRLKVDTVLMLDGYMYTSTSKIISTIDWIEENNERAEYIAYAGVDSFSIARPYETIYKKYQYGINYIIFKRNINHVK